MADRDELERYKRAMNDALQQLDWAIGYLQGINKPKVAGALAQNRQYIQTQIAGEKDEADLPSQEGSAAEEN